MAAIQNELRKKKMSSQYQVITNGYSKIYRRGERDYPVWSREACNRKIEEKMASGGRTAIGELFKSLYNTLYEYSLPGADLMLAAWFTECCDRMADAWEAWDAANPSVPPPPISAPATTEVEEFGVDVVEDFEV